MHGLAEQSRVGFGGGGEGEGEGGGGLGGEGGSGGGLGEGGEGDGGDGGVGGKLGEGSDGDGDKGGGLGGGDALQTAASSTPRELQSSAISCARTTLDGSVAIVCSVVLLTFLPKPHANTVTPSPLTSAAASTAVCHSVLPGAASTDCSPSVTSSTI